MRPPHRLLPSTIDRSPGPSFHLSHDSDSDPPPPGGVAALSVADSRGITIAVHKLKSDDVHWKTIGSNLIMYWAGDAGSINCYLKVVTKKFPDTRRVSFDHLIKFNQTSARVLPMDHWTGGSITVHVRDRYQLASKIENLLKMRISKSSIGMEAITINSSVIGTGARYADKMLEDFSSIRSCCVFDEDESLREHIVCKAIHKAMVKGRCQEGFCEIIRGSRKQGWRSIKEIDSEYLLLKYTGANR